MPVTTTLPPHATLSRLVTFIRRLEMQKLRAFYFKGMRILCEMSVKGNYKA